MKIQTFIKNRMSELNFSGVDVANNSDGIIDQSYVSKLLNFKIVNPSADKLRGLAKGLLLSEEIVFDYFKYPQSAQTVLINADLVEIQSMLSELDGTEKAYVGKLLKIVVREIRELKNFAVENA